MADTAPRHLTRAPITEAVIEWEAPGAKEAGLTAFAAAIAKEYPERVETVDVTAKFDLAVLAGGRVDEQPSVSRHVFYSRDRCNAIMFRAETMSAHRLRPYETWERFVSEARRVWNLYVDSARPVQVTRVSVRFINRLELPLPFNDFREYLKTAPEIAPDLPQQLSTFLFQATIPLPDTSLATLTQALQPGVPQATAAVILFDIDVQRSVAAAPGDPLLDDLLEQLRVAKNEIFFKSLTEKALELYR